jgi:hypothetical protein
MDKKVLKERLDEVKKQLRSNAKDVHFFDKLIDDALSLKGQISVPSTELDCGTKIDELAGETYRITITDRGVLYHEYGGYSLFATPNMTALYDTLVGAVKNKDKYADATEEEKEEMELMLSVIGYCTSLPKFVFSDPAFTLEIATRIVKYIQDTYDELMDKPLQPETFGEDAKFMEDAIVLEDMARRNLDIPLFKEDEE